MFLGYASPAGRTFLDRELYLPKAWAQDRPRCEQAAVPQDVEFVTKPELAIGMLTRALDAGVPASWVTGDEVYGQHPACARSCRPAACPTSCASRATNGSGSTRNQVAQVASSVAASSCRSRPWPRASRAGRSRKSPPAWVRRARGSTPGPAPRSTYPASPARRQSLAGWLLIRRSLTNPTDCAYYLCSAPVGTTLTTLVAVAGKRWAIEETFQTGKGEVGLDHHQVRRYDGWYRHMTLAMFAHAFLTVTRAASAGKGGHQNPTRTSSLSPSPRSADSWAN